MVVLLKVVLSGVIGPFAPALCNKVYFNFWSSYYESYILYIIHALMSVKEEIYIFPYIIQWLMQGFASINW